MALIVTLGGKKIKEPKDLEVQRFNLTKSGRTASGLMTMDFLAKKRKFLFNYDVLSGDDLTTLLSVIDTEEMFFPIVYIDEKTEQQKSATVYVGDIAQKKFRDDKYGWYWKDVKFDLIER